MLATSRRGRPVPRVDIHGAYVRRADLNGAILKDANLANADASGASFRHADFEGARLSGTILRGADLTGAINLTAKQLAEAVIDDDTRLPSGITRADLLSYASPQPGRS